MASNKFPWHTPHFRGKPGNLASDSDLQQHNTTTGTTTGTTTDTNTDTDTTTDVEWTFWLHQTFLESTPAPDECDRSTSTPDLISPSEPSSNRSPTDSLNFAPTPTPLAGTTPHIAPVEDVGYFPPTPEADPLERAFSRKRSSRTLTGLTALMPLTKKRSHRKKKVEGGYKCRAGCGRHFDRECDETKHFERKHRDESYWPHECLHCPKRSQYPKDVWRHLAQTHNLKVPPKEPQSIRKALGCPCCSKKASDWLQMNNLTLNTVPAVASPVSELSSPTTSPNLLWTLTQSIMKLRRLSLNSKKAREAKEGRFIMITSDKKRFEELDVSDITTADALNGRIASSLGLDSTRAQQLLVHTYNKRVVGESLTAHSLFSLVTNRADTEGSLKLFIRSSPH